MIVLLFIIISVFYLLLIGCFTIGFDTLKNYTFKEQSGKNSFSIIIPFRNEAEHLVSLLESINRLDYSHTLFEVILVNDSSDDDSLQQISNYLKASSTKFSISILQNLKDSKSPKKDAITLAIKNAKFDWIVTTDADCNVPKHWLKNFNAFIIDHNPNIIVAPVAYDNSKNFLEAFQQLDILSLQGVTIGAFGINKPFLCNGANLCYSKDFFYTVNGFKGNVHLATGDDMFLLEKGLNYNPDKVHYLKSYHSIVYTKPEETWSALIAQRLRWASKAKFYNNKSSVLCSFSVLLMNATLVVMPILVLVEILSSKTLFYFWFLKFSIDFWLIYKSAVFFKQKNALKFYWICFLIYPFFTTYIAIRSQIGGYSWKNRRY